MGCLGSFNFYINRTEFGSWQNVSPKVVVKLNWIKLLREMGHCLGSFCYREIFVVMGLKLCSLITAGIC